MPAAGSRLPDGWDTTHFNHDRLLSIVERAFFPYSRQFGFKDDDPAIREALLVVWRQYAFIKAQEPVIRNPGGLIWRLLRGSANKIADLPRPQPTLAPDLFAGALRKSDGQVVESI